MMKKLLLVKVSGIAMFIATLGATSAANATVRFTYESHELAWLASVVNDQFFFDVGSTDKPFFSLSFDAPDSWLTPGQRTEFSIPAPTISVWNESRPFTVSTDSPATIEINADGSISDWFFSYQVSPIYGAGDDPSVIAENKHYDLSSGWRHDSCACDHFDVITNYVGEGPDPIRGEMYRIYTDPNLSSPQWSVSQISAVPEPASYAMLMGGLGLFGVMGWRKRAAFPRPMQAALA